MTSLSTSNTKSSTTKYYNNLDNANEKIKQLEIENIKLKKLLTKYETNNNNSSKKIDDEQPLSTEQELRLTKALLLLQNVDVNVQLNDTSKPRQILLSGDADLLEELMTLRKQVRLLKQHNLVIRAQVLQLKIAIPQMVTWVQQSAHKAIELHAQQRRDLQNRLSRLKSVLKS